MHTSKFDVNSYCPCNWSFMKNYFIHNICNFEEKGRVRKGVLKILTLLISKMIKLIYI